MGRRPLLGFILSIWPLAALALPGKDMGLPEVMEGVDTPTAYTAARGTYIGGLRLYGDSLGGAGAHVRAGMAFFDKFFLGVGLTTNNLIGEGRVDADNPGVGAKIRFLDETGFRPTLALGWESRGYRVKDSSGHYPRAERGVYLAASKDLKVMLVHAGVAAAAPDKIKGVRDAVFHLGATTALFKALEFRGEWDDFADKGGGRFNFETRFTIAAQAAVAVDFVGIGAGTAALIGNATGAEPRVSGRMLTLEYRGLF